MVGRRKNILTLTMSRRSPFAASAYANAHESNTVEESDLFHYPGETTPGETAIIDDSNGTSNIPEALFLPLDGASVSILTNTSKSDEKCDSAYVNMKQLGDFHGRTVENFGGRVFELHETSITHAIWVTTDDDKGNDLSRLSNEALAKLHSCLANSIPIVTPLWLTEIGDLVPGQHWSEVDVEEYKPAIVKLLVQALDNDVHNKDGWASTSHHTSYNRSESRRDDSETLSASISETFRTLVDDNPDLMEEESIRRAMELSMLDFALVHHSEQRYKSHNTQQEQKNSNAKDKLPHEILGIPANATKEEMKMAYRRRALETHPDKGGRPGEFEAVAHAYRVLLNPNYDASLSSSFDGSEEQILKCTAHWDNELKDHRNLVRELYQNSEDIDVNLQRQSFTLERLGLRFKEAGSRIRNEKSELISNACFYISLASSYLSGIGALSVWGDDSIADHPDNALLKEADDELIRETALQLKRTIEAAVLSSHPEWAARGMVGEEIQAFSDFLVYILDSKTIVSDWAVVVFDKCSGFVDVYRGKNFQDEAASDRTMQTSNTLTIQYVPGHYQPLVSSCYNVERPSLKQILSVLDESGVLYVVTDGNA